MTWGIRRDGGSATRVLLGASLILLTVACASPQRNPFGRAEGPIHLTLVNNGRQAVSATLYGMGEPIGLGAFLGGETRFMEFTIEGKGEISVRLSRLNSSESYDTFRMAAEPGDRFLLEIENNLRLARLIRTRSP
jgi:hypothetical protein